VLQKSVLQRCCRFPAQKSLKVSNNDFPLHGRIFRQPWKERQVRIQIDRGLMVDATANVCFQELPLFVLGQFRVVGYQLPQKELVGFNSTNPF
jgi:hypothetical protein